MVAGQSEAVRFKRFAKCGSPTAAGRVDVTSAAGQTRLPGKGWRCVSGDWRHRYRDQTAHGRSQSCGY
jgi:hypothetical protein